MAARSSHASPAISPDKRLGLNPNWVHFPGAPSGSENGGKGLNRNENNVIEPERLTIFDRLGEVRPPLKLSQRMAPASPAPYSPPPPSSPSTPDSMRTKTQKTMFVQQPIRSSVSLS
ncbi:hypothetical protein SISSUDRAFT_1050889 [Sistotremastrum suecicum HHB10207 ss-3]|uniref:Uncharacterized protein n=1 Tax=Sistotremastrum suecicum HHB10207 ss-3 TaxID=1314776 RepID=A0A166AXE9_9AGAM|nr:hypothetical protein SISSUDRAFT_1050889 [Sistotremastrum suecicum HHB10207 ss-3]